ncbi:MAG TPA: hypothetical protein VFA08_12220 [Actinomycetota bacterium]|jgi:hypothetical protein|nr:hypothetical protein [Actinomycetota bacterium]
MRRRLPAIVLAIAVTGCGAEGTNHEPITTADILRAIVVSEMEPPARTRYFRTERGAASATQLVQDGRPELQVLVQRGLDDALTREFGTPGIIAMLLEGEPTESLDTRRDVWVASTVLAYDDSGAARAAQSVFVDATGRRLEQERNVVLGDGGTAFRGRFLRDMPVVTLLWRNERFVLHVMAVGAAAHSEIRAIGRDVDDRVP